MGSWPLCLCLVFCQVEPLLLVLVSNKEFANLFTRRAQGTLIILFLLYLCIIFAYCSNVYMKRRSWNLERQLLWFLTSEPVYFPPHSTRNCWNYWSCIMWTSCLTATFFWPPTFQLCSAWPQLQISSTILLTAVSLLPSLPSCQQHQVQCNLVRN